MLRGTLGSANFFLGGIGIFPKTVHAATEMQRLGVQHVHAHFATHPALAGFLIQRLGTLEALHIWLAILVGHATRCLLSVLRFRQGQWRGIEVGV